MSGLVLVSRAADFAARAHVDQHRKGPALEPYVNHLAEIAVMLSVATEGLDPVLVAAGWLHDTVEDTAVTLADLEHHFGPEVAGVVAEVTDDKSLSRDERKRRSVLTIASKSRRAQYLKVADQASNIRALVTTPPAGWTMARLVAYVDWGEAIVARVSERNPQLEAYFRSAVADARATFAARPAEAGAFGLPVD
jgi:(p)ppGpp synthase/HD superfamily hydrolase